MLRLTSVYEYTPHPKFWKHSKRQCYVKAFPNFCKVVYISQDIKKEFFKLGDCNWHVVCYDKPLKKYNIIFPQVHISRD